MSDQDATRSLIQATSQNILISRLSELNKTMEAAPHSFKNLASEISDANKLMAGLSKESSFKAIGADSDVGKDILNIYQTLRKTNQLIQKAESPTNTKESINFLERASRATTNTAGALHSWIKSSTSKTPRMALGTRKANTEAMAEYRAVDRESANYAQSIDERFDADLSTHTPKIDENLSADADSSPDSDSGGKKSIFSTKSVAPILDGMLGTLSKFNESVGTFTGAIGTAHATMMESFGNLLEAPFEGLIGIMSGLSEMISQSFSMFADILDSAVGFFSSLFDAASGAGKGDGGGASTIGGLLSGVMSLVSSLINVVVQAIQAGFNIFASTLTAVLKIVQKIALSSPIMRAILDLLNLAFTLFFMPFMNSFALALLPYVIGLLDWAVTTGQLFTELGGALGESFVEMLAQEGGIADNLLELAESFIKDFLPDMIELLPSLLIFATEFVKEILNNAPQIINFIKLGLDAFGAMLDAGILGTFLDFGAKVMVWMSANAPSLVVFTMTMMKGLMAIANFFAMFTGGGKNAAPPELLSTFDKTADDLMDDLNYSSSIMEDTKVPDGYYQASDGTTYAKSSINGGIPIINESSGGEYSLSETELKEIGKSSTVTIIYNSDILSRGDFKNEVKKIINDGSYKSTYR